MKYIALFLPLFLLSACFGMKSDITIKKNGSGTIALEYRISEDLLKLGSLDGNAGYPAIPVGEEDFKRTVDRIDGLKLAKFSSKTDDEDIIYHVLLDFSNITALITFLDTQGQYCTLTEKDGKQILTIIFVPGSEDYSPEMLELMPIIFDGYQFAFKLNVPEKCDVTFFNKGASKIEAPAIGEVKQSSKSIDFSAKMGDLFSINETVAMEIRW